MSGVIGSPEFKVITSQNPKRRLAEFYTAVYNISGGSGCLEGMKILDLGCGNGELCAEYEAKGASKVVGIDMSPDMISHCTPTAKATFAVANMYDTEHLEQILLDDMGTFDGISALWSLAFAQNVEALRNVCLFVKKALKPNGKFVIVVNNPAVIHNAPKITSRADLKNYKIELVTEEAEDAVMRTSFFDVNTLQTLVQFENKCFKIDAVLGAVSSSGLRNKRHGALDIDPAYQGLGYNLAQFINYIDPDGCTMCYIAEN